MRQHLQCNPLFGLLKDVNISFFLSFLQELELWHLYIIINDIPRLMWASILVNDIYFRIITRQPHRSYIGINHVQWNLFPGHASRFFTFTSASIMWQLQPVPTTPTLHSMKANESFHTNFVWTIKNFRQHQPLCWGIYLGECLK